MMRKTDIEFRRIKLSFELRKDEADGALVTKMVLWKGLIRMGSVTLPGVWTVPEANWQQAAGLMMEELRKQAEAGSSSPVSNVVNGNIERAEEAFTQLGRFISEEKTERPDLLAGTKVVRILRFQGGNIRLASDWNGQVQLSLFGLDWGRDLIRGRVAGVITMNVEEVRRTLKTFLDSSRAEGAGKNASSAVSAGIKNPGGINLDPSLLNLQIKRDQNWVPLPMEQQPSLQNMNIEGFYPVIINVTPVPSLPLLLGRDDNMDRPAPKAGAKKSSLDLSYFRMSIPVEKMAKEDYRLTRRVIER